MNIFRNDIAGLRAIAVILVIFYHFSVPGFSGGYIGVDIFFTISGYLMTGIIYSGLVNNNFSIFDFYLRRGLRIIPSMIVLCFVLILIGYFILPSVEYKKLGLSAISSLSFISNFILWQEADYFDTDSKYKWLLHTWSLSVEWQFYIIIPVITMLCWKVSSKKDSLVVLYIVLFLISLYMFKHNEGSISAFYLLPFRAWEMLAGGLIYLFLDKFTYQVKYLKLLELCGVGLIFYALTILDEKSSWPTWKVFIPIIGTCLILISAQNKSIFTSSLISQKIGLWSYSLYLWHWPVVVFINHVNKANDTVWVCFGLILALFMGGINYYLVEEWCTRKVKNYGALGQVKLLLGCCTILGLIAAYIYVSNGVYGRIDKRMDKIFTEAYSTHSRRDECLGRGGNVSPECIYGKKDSIGVMIVGDSHAASFISAVTNTAGERGVVGWTYIACPNILGINITSNNSCMKFNENALKRARSLKPEVPILIINRLSSYIYGKNEDDEDMKEKRRLFLSASSEIQKGAIEKAIVDTLCQYSEAHPVYTLRPIPEFKINVPVIARSAYFLGEEDGLVLPLVEYMKRHEFVWAAQDAAERKCGVTVLNPLPYLCDKDSCYATKDGVPLYFDDDHLNESGSKLIEPLFKSMFVVEGGN